MVVVDSQNSVVIYNIELNVTNKWGFVTDSRTSQILRLAHFFFFQVKSHCSDLNQKFSLLFD